MIVKMSSRGSSPFGIILAMLFLGLLLLGIFFFFAWMLRLLYFAGPVLILAAVILDYRTVMTHLRGIGRELRERPLRGVLLLGFNILGYPLVALFLIGQILLRRRLAGYEREFRRQEEGDAVEYVELESKPLQHFAPKVMGKDSSDLV